MPEGNGTARRMATRTRLCHLDEGPDGGSAGFTEAVGGRRLPLMVLRRGGRGFVFVNSCPHNRAPLDFTPGQFLNLRRSHILCTNHGALFRIEDGVCVEGPPLRRALERVEAEVANGEVWLRA